MKLRHFIKKKWNELRNRIILIVEIIQMCRLIEFMNFYQMQKDDPVKATEERFRHKPQFNCFPLKFQHLRRLLPLWGHQQVSRSCNSLCPVLPQELAERPGLRAKWNSQQGRGGMQKEQWVGISGWRMRLFIPLVLSHESERRESTRNEETRSSTCLS